MKILISGVAGFIGSHTLENWKGKKDKIWGIDNFSSGKPENLDGFIDRMEILFQEDIAERSKMLSIFNKVKPDVVLHLAAQPSLLTSIQNPILDAWVNVFGTLQLLEAAKYFGVKHFVFSSTSAVTEAWIQDPEMSYSFGNLPKSPYGISKFAAEMYVRSIFPDNHTILRYANIYGPRQVPLGENQLIPRAIRHILYGDDFEIYGEGIQTRDFTYVQDVAKCNYLACTKKITGTYYVATGEQTSVLDVLDIVDEILDHKELWKQGDSRQDRTHVQVFPDLFEHDFHYQPDTPLKDGIMKTAQWWIKQGEGDND